MTLFDLAYSMPAASRVGDPSLRSDATGFSMFYSQGRVVTSTAPELYDAGFTVEYALKVTSIGARNVAGGDSRIVPSVHSHSNVPNSIFELAFDNWNNPGVATSLTPCFTILSHVRDYSDIADRAFMIGEARGSRPLVIGDTYHVLGTLRASDGLCQVYINGKLQGQAFPNIDMPVFLDTGGITTDLGNALRSLRQYFEIGTRFLDGAWRNFNASGSANIDNVRWYLQHFTATQAAIASTQVAVTPDPIPKNAGNYSQSDFQSNPETISGGVRMDQWWMADGTRVWTVRDSANRCDQHDVSPAWSITPGDWSNRIDENTQFIDSRSIQLSPDGSRLLFMGGASNPFIKSYVLSTPFDLSSLGAATATFYNVGQLANEWSVDGLTCWVYRSSVNSIEEHAVSSAFDASTFNTTAAKTFDLTSDIGGINSFTFSPDGTFIYAIGAGVPNNLVSWQLSTPFDIDTAGSFTTGVSVGTAAEIGIPRGLFFRPDNSDLHLEQDQNQQRMKVFSD